MATESPATNPADLLTRAVIAARLNVNADTWSGYVSRGQAPAPIQRVGGTPLWDPQDIEEWEQSRRGRGRPRVKTAARPQGEPWSETEVLRSIEKLALEWARSDDASLRGAADQIEARLRVGGLDSPSL